MAKTNTDEPIQILIVDDEPKNLTVLETVLDDPNYRLVRAESANQALLALVVQEFALIILDIRMPDMNGFELAQLIKDRKKTAQVPIIFLTAYYNEDQHVLEGYQTGAVDYLHKPVNPVVLRSKVAVFAEMHRKNHEIAMANRSLLAEITERQRAEARLRELNETLERRVAERTQSLRTSEAKFRGLLESAPDGVVVIDQQGAIILVNAQIEQIFKYPREQLFGQSLAMLVPERFRNRKADCLFDFALAEAGSANQAGGEFLGQSKDGREFPIEVSRRQIETETETIVFCAIRDISDRKRSEEALRVSESRWRFALEVSEFGAWEVNFTDGTFWRSTRHDEIFGYKELLPEWSDEIFLQHVQEEFRTEAPHYFDNGTSDRDSWSFECPIRRVDGIIRWIWICGRQIRDSDGRPTRTFGLIADVTSRKQAEEALLSENRRKDEFLATLAHELRNPLAPVRNALQILHLKNVEIPDLQWAMDVIDRQVQVMSRLIDDLMDVSRINRGKIELKRERIALSKLIQDAIEASRPVVEQMGHELRVTVPAEPLVLDADLTRLTQVLLNLLNNAAKYTDRGGQIELNAERQGGSVVISVIDTGVGIPAASLSSIFEMFSQVEGALTRSQGGLGIGLSLAKQLVEMHGGTISVHSEGLGHGSEFIVRLPIIVDETTSSPHGQKESSSLLSSELRILIVDDNHDAAASLAILLKMMGNSIRIAHDGEEGADFAEDFRPHVVVCDIGLPKMNGYELCAHLRQQPWCENAVLIAVTGWGQDEDKQKARAAGFDQHLVKPVDPHALMALLASLRLVRS